METRKVYYCYKATNQVNGKVYIGFATDPEKRWSQHKRDAEQGRGYIFHQAIRKHGWNNFKFEILCCGLDKRSMLEHVEPQLIQQYNSSIPHGYNMHKKVVGAVGRTPDKRIRRKRYSDEVKAAIGERMKENAHRKGKPDPPSRLKQKSQQMAGNQRTLGYKHTIGAKQKIAAAARVRTPAQQEHHKVLCERGVATRFTKAFDITTEQKIAQRLLEGELVKNLAVEYGVCRHTISKVKRRTYHI